MISTNGFRLERLIWYFIAVALLLDFATACSSHPGSSDHAAPMAIETSRSRSVPQERRSNWLASTIGTEIAASIIEQKGAGKVARDACNDVSVTNAQERVFEVNVTISPQTGWRSPGTSCVPEYAHLNPGVRAVVFSTFNDAWFYRALQTQLRPFHSKSGTRMVPTGHYFVASPISRTPGLTSVILPFRDQRYAIVLVSGALSSRSLFAIAKSSAAQDRLTAFTDAPHLLRADIYLPMFALRGTTNRCEALCGTRAISNAFLQITGVGAGTAPERPQNVPKLLPATNMSIAPIRVAFDTPFDFAIIDYWAHVVLFMGHVDQPSLNP